MTENEECRQALKRVTKQVAEECAMMAYKAGHYLLACDILDRYIWKLKHEGTEVHDLFSRQI